MKLREGEAPWLAVAAAVLAGRYDGADSSTRESLTIGLRHIDHPDCRDAVKRLWPVLPTKLNTAPPFTLPDEC